MTTVLTLLPLLVAVLLGAALVTTIVQMWRRYQHPLRLALQAVGASTVLGVLGIAGALPGSLWWASWLFALGILLGIAVSARRLLVKDPPTDPSPRRAALLDPPSRTSAIGEGLFWVLLVVIALVAG